ncbi:MAG TPA: MFS transporter [Bryobacteraceae bacterium]|jgi:MFS family permease|nr:MFS transporter [Bryobacteraceae bacterium]
MSRRWVVVSLIVLGILISYIDRGNLSIAAPAMMQDFAISPQFMGVLLSAFFWTYAAFQIPAGAVVDRFGVRSIYAGAFLIWSLASAGIALAHGPTGVLTLRMVLGLAEAVGPLASLAYIRRNFSGSEHGLPIALYISGQNLGPACGTLLGAALLANFGWRVMFAVTGLGALLWIPFWLAAAPHQERKSAVELQPVTQSPWGTLVGSRAFWAMCPCVLLFSYYWYFLLTWMPTYLISSRGFSTMGMGRILSTPLFIMAGLNVMSGWVADKLVERVQNVFKIRILFAACGLLGAGAILILDVLPGRGPVLPVLIVSICSFGIASSNYWSIVQHTPPAAMVARTVGFLNTLSQIGGVLAPLVTGWTLGPRKNFTLAIFLAGICPVISCGLLLLAGPKGLEELKQRL